MKFAFSIIIIWSGLFSQTVEPNPQRLVGLWQDYDNIASGWTDTYQFFPNGNFIFRYNQMDCDRRNISFSGRWYLLENRMLELDIFQREIMIGGHLEQSFGSCGTDSALVGAKLQVQKLSPAMELKLGLEIIETVLSGRPDSGKERKRMKIGGKYFFKMKDDPNKY
jgi:hypothetical protein